MTINPEYIASALLLINEHKEDRACRAGTVELVEPHDWVLPARLPPMSRLVSDAKQAAIEARRQYILDASMAQALKESLDRPSPEEQAQEEAATHGRTRSASSSTSGSSSSRFARPAMPTFGRNSGTGKAVRKRTWEAHDVYRAIERKDLTTLFEIRDAAFHLLVQKTGAQTPLLYASRIGKSHREIAILLTGALSRFVNQLPDDSSILAPATLSLIRAVRANLKLAINESLTTNQTELVSSYLQIIIMSEGEKWIASQTQNVALAIRAGKEAKPVATARAAVTSFATRELRSLEKGAAVASVEDYLANATNDLVMMALWSLVTDKVGGGLLPSYQFGRDDRIHKTFSDSLNEAERRNPDFAKRIPKQLRSQIDGTLRIVEGRATGHAEKSRALVELFDAP